MLTSHVVPVLISCHVVVPVMFTAHSSLFTIHWSVLTIHIFTASSLLHYCSLIYHCSLFTELEWHLYTSTETQHRVPTSVRLAVAKLWQRPSYSISILMSIGRKLWNYMCMIQHFNTIIGAPAPLVPIAVPVLVSCQVMSLWLWTCGYKAYIINIIVCTIIIILKFVLGS